MPVSPSSNSVWFVTAIATVPAAVLSVNDEPSALMLAIDPAISCSPASLAFCSPASGPSLPGASAASFPSAFWVAFCPFGGVVVELLGSCPICPFGGVVVGLPAYGPLCEPAAPGPLLVQTGLSPLAAAIVLPASSATDRHTIAITMMRTIDRDIVMLLSDVFLC